MINMSEVDLKKDKQLAENIITLFLSHENLDTIAKKVNQNVEFVTLILNYKKMIVKCFGEQTWNEVEIRKAEIVREEKEAQKEAQYEQLMKNIIFYMLNSLYTYGEIAQHVFANKKIVQEMISNTDYISKKFGKKIVSELKKMIEVRKNLLSRIKNYETVVVKDPKYRKLVNPNILVVSNYEYSLIEKVCCFFENDGSTEKMVQNNTLYHLNDIMISLKDNKLKNLLLPNVYERLKTLLEVDIILTQNRLADCYSLIKEVLLKTYEENGNAEIVQDTLNLPICMIERILNHPYTQLVCKNLQISPSDVKLKKLDEKSQIIVNIADYIIEHNASYEEAAKEFGIGKSTIGEYMKDKLPLISEKRSKQINQIVGHHTSTKVLTEEMQERILLEYELLMRGYNLTQIAYLINNSYATVQRDISKRLPILSEEKGKISKDKLEHNKSKIYRKN